jgi:uncharacterized protein with PQ loop repeat
MLIKIIENILIIAAEAFWILSNWSQLRRLIKTKDRKGLSAPNQALNAAGNIAWIAYFSAQSLPVPVTTNLIMFAVTLTTLAYTLSNKKQFLKGATAIMIIGPLTAYLLITFASMSGWIAVAYNFVASLPWLIHILTTKRTSGISEKSLIFTYSAILSTLTYATMVGTLPLQVGTLIGLLNITAVTIYYYRYRHTMSDEIITTQ